MADLSNLKYGLRFEYHQNQSQVQPHPLQGFQEAHLGVCTYYQDLDFCLVYLQDVENQSQNLNLQHHWFPRLLLVEIVLNFVEMDKENEH